MMIEGFDRDWDEHELSVLDDLVEIWGEEGMDRRTAAEIYESAEQSGDSPYDVAADWVGWGQVGHGPVAASRRAMREALGQVEAGLVAACERGEFSDAADEPDVQKALREVVRVAESLTL